MEEKEIEQNYLSVAQFAAQVKITRAYIHRMIVQGRIPAIKLGRSFFIKKSEIEKVNRRDF